MTTTDAHIAPLSNPTHSAARARRLDAIALAGLAGFVLALFGRLVFTNRVLANGDVWTYFTPYRDFAAAALRAGHLPLWNPYLFLGAPFLANSQAAVFYPLHWPLAWLSTSRAIVWSIALHVWLGGAFTYGWLRRGLGMRPLAAWLGGIVFAGSGFIGGHVGQINQLNAYAWFPALLWALTSLRAPAADLLTLPWRHAQVGRDFGELSRAAVASAVKPTAAIGAIFALQLFAGHTQAWYISAIGAGLYALAGVWAVETAATAAKSAVADYRQPPKGGSVVVAATAVARRLNRYLRSPISNLQSLISRLPSFLPRAWPLLILALGLVIGVGLAAVQLLPTLELSALSPRANGLTYREVVSFSLKPQWLPWALLPAYGQNLAARFGSAGFAEYVAYIGFSGLLLGAWGARQAGRWRWPLLILALGGLALAVGAYNPLYYLAYRLIPGWALFRAPARWLLLYTAGMAGLVALGADALQASRRPLAPWLALAAAAILVAELLAASSLLPHTKATAPEAVTSWRNAPAYLRSEPGLWRFLSMSGITYDPGDQAELTSLFAGQLDAEAMYDLIVASKQKEIVAPNLPLFWRLPSVDGYDGGVLPLARYVELQRLFVPDDQLVPDGRLREQLRRVPSAPLLDLVNARFIVTDKVFDVWVDGVYYDLQFSAELPAGAVWRQAWRVDQSFEATGLGVMSHLDGAAALPDGAPVATVRVKGYDGQQTDFVLRAGQDTAEGAWHSGEANHPQARVGHPWRDHADGQDYLTILTLTVPSQIAAIEVTGAADTGRFVLQAISLIDARSSASQALITPGQGDFQRVHSGDVKIYDKRDVLPRVYVVPAAHVIEAANADAALAALRQPGFAPDQVVVLETGRTAPAAAGQDGQEAGHALIERYAPEQVVISATLTAPGILVLSDANFPGWHATVDGAPARIEQANLLFRGLRLPPGMHRITFDYAPDSVRLGALITMATLALVSVLWLWSQRSPRS